MMLFICSLWGEEKPRERIGNKKIPPAQIQKFGQGKLREDYRFFASVALPDGLYKLAAVSLGYNLNEYISIGISQNFTIQYYRDFGSSESFGGWNKGVLYSVENSTQQDYGYRKRVPNMGTNVFVHIYPFIKENIPIYIPLYLGKTRRTEVIQSSENTVFSPAYSALHPGSDLPVINLTAEALPAFYAGAGLGAKIFLPYGLFFGMEFGYTVLHQPQMHYRSSLSFFNRAQVSIPELAVLNEQVKLAFPAADTVKMNYGFLAYFFPGTVSFTRTAVSVYCKVRHRQSFTELQYKIQRQGSKTDSNSEEGQLLSDVPGSIQNI